MSGPKVSICIPAYKQPELLQKALESVEIQNYKDYEVIITDDSPDNSVENIAEMFKNRISNLTYIKNKVRQGSPENWNAGIKLAQGEYIKILHHDDWFPDSEVLSKFVKLLDDNPEAIFAWGGTIDKDQKGNVIKYVKTKSEDAAAIKKDPRYLFIGNFIGAPSATIYRKSADLLFDKHLKWMVDVEFYMQILFIKNNFVFTTEPLICVLSESEERVTAECINNKTVQIFEHTYVYRKIGGPINHERYKNMWALFEQFHVASLEEIYKMGMDDPIPKDIVNLVRFQQISNKLKHIVYLIKKFLTIEIWIGFISRSIAYLVSMF